MKQFYLIVTAILFFNLAYSAPVITADQNGNWLTTGTWNLNRRPKNGDTIVIPAGKVVVLNGSQTLNDVYLKIDGTLRIGGFLTYLSVNASSTLLVSTGGRIEATLDYFQYIIFGGQTIFYAHHVFGPLVANNSSNGFMGYNPLPVKFAGFTAFRKNASDVMLQWSTTEELNSHMYEVERSFNGSDWNTIAYVSAVGNSNDLNNYSYTDKKITAPVVYYRVKQVDADGRFSITDIKMIKAENIKVTQINIASVQGKVLMQFPAEVKGNMIVRFISLGGQVVDQQVINQPFGQVILSTKSHVKGNYIVSVSNGKDVNVAKQVIL